MIGFVLAILACTGSNCELTNLEPGSSFPTYEACQAELAAKEPSFKDRLEQARSSTRTAEAVCIREIATITEVESPYDVIDTAIVHSEPSANSPYVGIVESGKRTLVTGVVEGTQWVRVVLPDGKTGYVFADHLRQVRAPPPPAAAAPPAAPPAIAQAPPPAAGPSGQAPRAEETAAHNPGAAKSRAPKSGQAGPVPAPPAGTSSGTEALVAAVPKSATQQHEFRDCEHCPTLVALPGGEFAMGSNADPTERPIHRVRIGPFAIGKFELSVAEWQACVAAGGCSFKPNRSGGGADRRPVDNLSWDDAQEYVRWLQKTTGKQYRLLTEAEWEYAARAGTTTRYSWGEAMKPGRADCDGCGPGHDRSRPADMGSFPPNAWGLYDLEGNVAEWVEDCWHSSYKGAPADGEAWRGGNCGSRVLRGGSWNNPPSDITVSSRNFYDSSVRYPGNGMRVALTLR